MYVIVVMRMDEVEEVIGPFDTRDQVDAFMAQHELGGWARSMQLSAPDGWEGQ